MEKKKATRYSSKSWTLNEKAGQVKTKYTEG